MAEKQEETKDKTFYDAIFAKVNELKATGNTHIQKNEIQNALICYAKASQELDSSKFIDCKITEIIQQYISLSNQIYGNVSLCYFKKENYEYAKDYSEKILLTDPLNFKSYFRLAQIYKKLNLFNQAMENIQAAIEIANDPKYKISSDQLKQCQKEMNEIKKLKNQ